MTTHAPHSSAPQSPKEASLTSALSGVGTAIGQAAARGGSALRAGGYSTLGRMGQRAGYAMMKNPGTTAAVAGAGALGTAALGGAVVGNKMAGHSLEDLRATVERHLLDGTRSSHHEAEEAHDKFGKMLLAGQGTDDDHDWHYEANSRLDAKAKKLLEKKASLVDQIAMSVKVADLDLYDEALQDSTTRHFFEKSAHVMGTLSRLTAGTRKPAEKVASAPLRADVIQVRPTAYGYRVKYAAAPDGTEPQEQEMSVPQAQQALPPEMLQAADEQGAATITNVEAEPDPLEENPQPITEFGLYKVFEAGTGKQLVGFVIPSLFDPGTGGSTPTSLFVNGGQYALQGQVQGVLLGKSFSLPEGPEDPRGLGVFYKTNGKGIIATVPYEIVTSVTVEGVHHYAARMQTGQEITITPSDGLTRPIMISPTEVAIPIDFVWLPLDNQVMLDDGGMGAAAPLTNMKVAAAPTKCVIRAWRSDKHGGGLDLSGPVFDKVGSGTHSWEDGVFWLAAAGCPQNLSVAMIDKAASTGLPVALYGLRPLTKRAAALPEKRATSPEYDAARKKVPHVCLLKEALALESVKEARDLVGVDSIDNLLAIGAINDENIAEFVDWIPQLEETSSKLANLVFATQIGLPSISKTAATRAMQTLETVITGLKGLKTYKL